MNWSLSLLIQLKKNKKLINLLLTILKMDKKETITDLPNLLTTMTKIHKNKMMRKMKKKIFQNMTKAPSAEELNTIIE
jgi:hypothetical protein